MESQMDALTEPHEPTEEELHCDRIGTAFCELRTVLKKTTKDNKPQARAKLLALAALLETADDIPPFVWKHVDKEMRLAAFQIVVGSIASTLE